MRANRNILMSVTEAAMSLDVASEDVPAEDGPVKDAPAKDGSEAAPKKSMGRLTTKLVA
jgi:hypothetical protein